MSKNRLSLQKEIAQAIAKLKDFSNLVKEEQQAILAYAADPLVREIESRAPKGVKIHKRYAQSAGGKRSPKGKGKVVATYHPGNLKKSIRVLRFRRSRDVFVGGKLAKRGQGGGEFGRGNKVDAYYMHYVEFGTSKKSARPFIRPSIPAAMPAVAKRVREGYEKLVKTYGKTTKIKE